MVEELGHDYLTERVVIALLPEYPLKISVVRKRVEAVEEAMEGRHWVGIGTASGRQVVVEDLEQQIKDYEIS